MSKRDYYDVLGIQKNATDKEMKQAYRKLAKKYHPDTNAGDKQAEDNFKEVTEAYNILSDAEKRKQYDQFGFSAFDDNMGNGKREGNGSFYRSGDFDFGDGMHYQEYHFTGGGEDIFGDIFGDIFQGSFDQRTKQAQDKGSNFHSEITITFEEAAFGCDKVLQFEQNGINNLQVHIPAGIDEGQSVRLKGKGQVGYRGKAGDLLLKVHIMNKPGFERKGMDVYVTTSIPYTTAVLGGEEQIQTLYGKVACKIPAGIQPGGKIRLKNKGIVSLKNPGIRGDEYVVVQIWVPKNTTQKERELLEELEEVQKSKRHGGVA